MWNKVTSSKIVDKKIKLYAYKKHKHNLKNVRSTIDNSSPKEYDFINTKPKAKMLKLCMMCIIVQKLKLK